MESMSDKNKKYLLQAALVSEYGLKVKSPIPKKLTIEEVFGDRIIYDVDGQLYETTYELEDGKPTFGEPRKVTATKIFKSMESLRETYADIIQEAGKRNAALDSTRLSKIMALLTELMDREEEPNAKETKEALREADGVLTWLKEQAATKTEDG